MKRMALCVFSLIAFVLIFCSLLAPSVEREMRTLVDVHRLHEELKMYNHWIPTMAVKWPDGVQLYQVVEGKGWNAGDRIQEVSRTSYITMTDPTSGEVIRVEVLPGKDFDIVLAASRQLEVGDRIVVVKEFQDREDTYIICYPEGATNMDGYPASYTKIAQSQQALLVTPKNASAPYFEQTVLNSLRGMETDELRAYSVSDIKQFYSMLPMAFLLAVILLLGLFLWGYSCILAKKAESPWLLWRNAAFGVGLLCFIPTIGSRIDLPASLLPKDNILDFGHYRREFRQIFAALESVNSNLLQQERSQCMRSCGQMLAAGVLLMVVLVCIDCWWRKRRRAKSL